MDNNKLPDNVWEAARLIWENTITITDRELVGQLHAHFSDEAPKSIGTISKRRKKEGWVKNNLVTPAKNKGRKRATKQEPKVETKQGDDDGNRKQNRQDLVLLPIQDKQNNRAEKKETRRSKETKNSTLEEITKNVVIDAKGRAKIILEHREVWSTIRGISKQTGNLLLDIMDAVEDKDADPEDLQKKFVVVGVLSQTLDSLTKSQKIISEVEMPLCGIGADDFKQSDRERRMGALAKIGNIDEEERLARDRLIPELNQRLRDIEATAASPDFGRDTNDDDDDIDEVDYTAVD